MAKVEHDTGAANRWILFLGLIAAAMVAWSVFLWLQLIESRTGGEAICAFGGDCAALWDGAFASTVHRLTRVPVAGWGVIWGLAALFQVLAWSRGKKTFWLAALKVMGLVGAVGVALLLLISALAGGFCSSCAVIYGLLAIFAAILWGPLKGQASAPLGGGMGRAALSVVAAFLLALVPGLSTPKSQGAESREALQAALDSNPSAAETASSSASSASGTAASGAAANPDLRNLIDSLSPQLKQGLSNALEMYRKASPLPLKEPRVLEGPVAAPVRITEFTDTLCSHCAELQLTLGYLKGALPASSFSIEKRQYPLDGNCNSDLPIRGPETVRCLAARAKICMETVPNSSSFAADLYREQRNLTDERVYALAAPFLSRPELDACMTSEATATKLKEDVALASQYDPHGTPVVLINGRQGSAFGPFLYAMILTGGEATDPAFDRLPAPRLDTHMH
ncbi:MAG: thioredoxin domain-containing protein [Deltaproteobacteria bacterium]|nr:thioredoxin domain-containing protein [Deltaproteobacteria bacterium]